MFFNSKDKILSLNRKIITAKSHARRQIIGEKKRRGIVRIYLQY